MVDLCGICGKPVRWWQRKRGWIQRAHAKCAKPKVVPKAPEPKVSEIDLNIKHRVTRFDLYDAVLTALMDTHPKIKNHPEIKDFVRRNEERNQELKSRGGQGKSSR